MSLILTFVNYKIIEHREKEKEHTFHTVTPGKASDSNVIWNPYTVKGVVKAVTLYSKKENLH
jgi:hypothetical protein